MHRNGSRCRYSGSEQVHFAVPQNRDNLEWNAFSHSLILAHVVCWKTSSKGNSGMQFFPSQIFGKETRASWTYTLVFDQIEESVWLDTERYRAGEFFKEIQELVYIKYLNSDYIKL
jgi:hypothetical protein